MAEHRLPLGVQDRPLPLPRPDGASALQPRLFPHVRAPLSLPPSFRPGPACPASSPSSPCPPFPFLPYILECPSHLFALFLPSFPPSLSPASPPPPPSLPFAQVRGRAGSEISAFLLVAALVGRDREGREGGRGGRGGGTGSATPDEEGQVCERGASKSAGAAKGGREGGWEEVKEERGGMDAGPSCGWGKGSLRPRLGRRRKRGRRGGTSDEDGRWEGGGGK